MAASAAVEAQALAHEFFSLSLPRLIIQIRSVNLHSGYPHVFASRLRLLNAPSAPVSKGFLVVVIVLLRRRRLAVLLLNFQQDFCFSRSLDDLFPSSDLRVKTFAINLSLNRISDHSAM